MYDLATMEDYKADKKRRADLKMQPVDLCKFGLYLEVARKLKAAMRDEVNTSFVTNVRSLNAK